MWCGRYFNCSPRLPQRALLRCLLLSMAIPGRPLLTEVTGLHCLDSVPVWIAGE
jgi:hypothetical protein